MFAARNGHKEIVELLLKHDANYNHKDNEGLLQSVFQCLKNI